MTTMSAFNKNYRRQLPTPEEAGIRPPHPRLLRLALSSIPQRTFGRDYQATLMAAKMSGSLQRLADGEWHEFCPADRPPDLTVKNGLVEIETLERGQRRYRITKTGLRIHKQHQKTPKPEPKNKAVGRPMRPARSQAEGRARLDWQQAFNLLIALG